LSGHGVKSGTGVGWVSWKKRRGVSPPLPARKPLAFNSLQCIAVCKIFITNGLRPKYSI
jgi:hypothetical protein